jgi:hypothetical protein
MNQPISLLEWIDERLQNCLRIAQNKQGDDRDGWIEDAAYFTAIKDSVSRLMGASADRHENAPLRMYIALKILRAWNSGTAGFSSDVVLTVNRWIDGGMKGPIPWPEGNPAFDEWAAESGLSKVGSWVGFKCVAELRPT